MTGLLVAWLAQSATAHAQFTVRSAHADTKDPIQTAITQFRADLGGNDNGAGAAASTGRREITWDDVPDTLATPATFPADYYRSSRGLKLSQNHFFVSMDDNTGDDPDADVVRFADYNDRHAVDFQAYSEQRLFTPGTPGFLVDFVVPGTTIPATVKGFGAVFVDVTDGTSTSMEFFGHDGRSLGIVSVPAGKYSFVGVTTLTAYEIRSVMIRNGNRRLGDNNYPGNDVVVLDDFIYGEPLPPAFEISATRTVASESPATNFQLVVNRLGVSTGNASVELTMDGTAQWISDYFMTWAPVTFGTGETQKTVGVSIVNDTLYEGLETATFALRLPSAGYVLRPQNRATVLIADDELVAPMAYGTTFDNKLVAFRLDNPNAVIYSEPITGLAAGEHVVGLDYRSVGVSAIPYAVTSANRIYRILAGSPATAFPVANAPFSPGLTANTNYAADIDFDARLDQLRVVSTSTTSLRVNPDTGMNVTGALDPAFVYAAGDAQAGQTPRLSGFAYTHSFPGATQTFGYGIDATTSTLVKVDETNPNALTTIGPLGVTLTSTAMDIQQGTHFAFMVGQTPTLHAIPYLYLIDLFTGRAHAIGSVGTVQSPTPVLRTLTIVPSGVLRLAAPERITVDEGGTAQVQVERVGGTVGELRARLEFGAGNATPTEDLESNGLGTQSLIFGDGVSKLTPLRFKAADDTKIEGTEEIRLNLVSEARNYTGAPATTLLRIIDNDQAAISIDDVTVEEGNTGTTQAVFTVRVNRTDPNAITVKFATEDGNAKAHEDYVPVSGTVTFAPGATTQTIAVAIIGDNFPEGASETVRVKLAEPVNASFIDEEAIGTITDGDTQPTYYLAEGATGPFFDTDILLANPHATNAPVTLTFLKQDATSVVQTITLAPTSRTTVRLDEVPGLESTAVSTLVTSTSGLPIVVERTMRWDASSYGAHTERAVEGAATTWYFAEGSQGFFSMYLLLANPQATANTATVQYLREGDSPVTRNYTIAANARETVDVSRDADLVNRSFGMVVTFAQPGVAERAMYFGVDPLWKAGHESAGVTTPSPSWFLAEGATGDFFETFVLLSNPQTVDAEVTLTFLVTGGAPIVKTKTIPASARLTVNIEAEDPALANVAVGTQVSSSVPIIVERAQYWPFAPDQWNEAHNSFGITALGLKWGLAEGRTGGRDNYQTYVLLANPGNTAAEVTATFLRTNGTTVTKTVIVPPASRFNIATGADGLVPELVNEDFSVIITSTQPIAVERAMYLDAGGVWSAGTNATATRLP